MRYRNKGCGVDEILATPALIPTALLLRTSKKHPTLTQWCQAVHFLHLLIDCIQTGAATTKHLVDSRQVRGRVNCVSADWVSLMTPLNLVGRDAKFVSGLPKFWARARPCPKIRAKQSCFWSSNRDCQARASLERSITMCILWISCRASCVEPGFRIFIIASLEVVITDFELQWQNGHDSLIADDLIKLNSSSIKLTNEKNQRYQCIATAPFFHSRRYSNVFGRSPYYLFRIIVYWRNKVTQRLRTGVKSAKSSDSSSSSDSGQNFRLPPPLTPASTPTRQPW